jgi:hypothetical protein
MLSEVFRYWEGPPMASLCTVLLVDDDADVREITAHMRRGRAHPPAMRCSVTTSGSF